MVQERFVEQFQAVDQAGNLYSFLVYEDVIQTETIGESCSISGQLSIYTVSGLEVNKIGENTYQIVRSGVIVTRKK